MTLKRKVTVTTIVILACNDGYAEAKRGLLFNRSNLDRSSHGLDFAPPWPIIGLEECV